MVWYLGHQVKGRTSGAQESVRINYGGKSYEILMGRWPTFFNRDTTIIGLPAGCVGHDIHFTGYRETNIIVLGKCSNHHICLRFRSGWCQDIPDSSSLERKMKVCNTNRRDDVARFSGEWTTVVSSKTWAGSATSMWTRCPRQAWSPGSLKMKHYRVQGEPSTRISKSLRRSNS